MGRIKGFSALTQLGCAGASLKTDHGSEEPWSEERRGATGVSDNNSTKCNDFQNQKVSVLI